MRSPLARCSKFAWTVCLALLASCASTQGAKQSAESVFLDLWTSGDYGIAEKTLAPTYTWRENSRTGSGNEAYKAFVAGHREAFPDIAFEIKQTIAEGGMVMVRRISQGTHEGTPPTGRRVEVNGSTLWRFEVGRPAEGWTTWDETGMLRQLGLAE